MLNPIEAQPGLFRDTNTGQIINTRDTHQYETSEKVVGCHWEQDFTQGRLFIMQGWRFTVPRWPEDGLEVQQQACLFVGDTLVSQVALGSILTCTAIPNARRFLRSEDLQLRLVRANEKLRIALMERPVEIGLRLHIRGLLLNLVS